MRAWQDPTPTPDAKFHMGRRRPRETLFDWLTPRNCKLGRSIGPLSVDGLFTIQCLSKRLAPYPGYNGYEQQHEATMYPATATGKTVPKDR